MTPRFLVDRGSATVSAALVARIDGRWRLVVARAFPATVDLDRVLEVVAEEGGASLAQLEPGDAPLGHWHGWEFVEATSPVPPGIAVLAPNARRAADLAAAAEQAGWRVAARVSPDRDDGVATGIALGDRSIVAVAVAGADPPRSDERDHLATLAAHAGAVVARRPELMAILAGAAADHRDRFPFERVVLAPAPQSPGSSGPGNELTRLLMAVGGQTGGGRLRATRSLATLAEIRGETVEMIEVGASAGAWFRAAPGDDGALEGFILTSGALVPPRVEDDEEVLDQVIAWSPLRLDRPTHRDRLRELATHPWWDAAGEGALLRMAAARAAMVRIEDRRIGLGGSPADRTPAAALLVLAGGAFALAPGAAIALAATDTIRRPGLMGLAYDHARMLGPIGMLDDGDRRELISDLADDLLLPLGSVLMIAGGRPGREVGTLSVASPWATSEAQPLSGGALRLIELPPGASADLDLDLREGRLGQARARDVALQASGGLGGLLVDTRGVPLRLPQAGERRREVLAQWQRSLWPGAAE